MNREDILRKLFLFFSLMLWLSGCTSIPLSQVILLAAHGCAPMNYEQVSAQGTLSPNQSSIAIASDSGIALYDVQTKSLRACLESGRSPRPTFVFSADSKFLVVAGYAGYPIKLWQLEPDLTLIFSQNSLLETNGVALSPNNQLLAILGWDGAGSSHYLGGTLKIWNVSSGQLIREFKPIYAIKVFSQDSSELEVSVCTRPETVCEATEIQRLSLDP